MLEHVDDWQQLIEQFMEKVRLPANEGADDCWIWLGALSHSGYPLMTIKGEQFPAHRVAYEILVGVRVGMLPVRRRCGNRLCVRPQHLYLGQKEPNMPRGVRTDVQTRQEIIALGSADPPARPDDIAAELGISLNTVYRVLREADLVGKILHPERAHLTEEATAKMIERYLANEDVGKLLAEYAISQASFYRVLRENNIPTRQELSQEVKRRALDEAVLMYEQGFKIWKITQVTGVSGHKLNAELHARDIPMRRADYGTKQEIAQVEAALSRLTGSAQLPSVPLDPTLIAEQ